MPASDTVSSLATRLTLQIELVRLQRSVHEKRRRSVASGRTNPLKQWRISPVDERAQELWDEYTRHKKRCSAGPIRPSPSGSS